MNNEIKREMIDNKEKKGICIKNNINYLNKIIIATNKLQQGEW